MNDLERLGYALYEQERQRAIRAGRVMSYAGAHPDCVAVEPWEECKAVFIKDARALLQELRNPSEGMVEAGMERSFPHPPAPAFTAMIDHILGQEEV